MHGGSAPQVIKSAGERLKALAPKAVTVLDGAMDEDNPFVRLAAAKDVLDRSGHARRQEITGADGGPLQFTLKIDRGEDDDGDS